MLRDANEWKTDYTFFTAVQSETDDLFTIINGVYFCYEDCFPDDWYIQATDCFGRVLNRFSNSQSSFDPILLG